MVLKKIIHTFVILEFSDGFYNLVTELTISDCFNDYFNIKDQKCWENF